MRYAKGTKVYKNTDRRGRVVWYRWSPSQHRVFRMAAAEAEVGVATGHYEFRGRYVSPAELMRSA